MYNENNIEGVKFTVSGIRFIIVKDGEVYRCDQLNPDDTFNSKGTPGHTLVSINRSFNDGGWKSIEVSSDQMEVISIF